MHVMKCLPRCVGKYQTYCVNRNNKILYIDPCFQFHFFRIILDRLCVSDGSDSRMNLNTIFRIPNFTFNYYNIFKRSMNTDFLCRFFKTLYSPLYLPVFH